MDIVVKDQGLFLDPIRVTEELPLLENYTQKK